MSYSDNYVELRRFGGSGSNNENNTEQFLQYSQNRSFDNVSDIVANRMEGLKRRIDDSSQVLNNKRFKAESDFKTYRSYQSDNPSNVSDDNRSFRNSSVFSSQPNEQFTVNKTSAVNSDYQNSELYGRQKTVNSGFTNLNVLNNSKNKPDSEKLSGLNSPFERQTASSDLFQRREYKPHRTSVNYKQYYASNDPSFGHEEAVKPFPVKNEDNRNKTNFEQFSQGSNSCRIDGSELHTVNSKTEKRNSDSKVFYHPQQSRSETDNKYLLRQPDLSSERKGVDEEHLSKDILSYSAKQVAGSKQFFQRTNMVTEQTSIVTTHFSHKTYTYFETQDEGPEQCSPAGNLYSERRGTKAESRINDLYTERVRSDPLTDLEENYSYSGRRDGPEHTERSDLYCQKPSINTERFSGKNYSYPEKQRGTVPVQFSQGNDFYSGRRGGVAERYSPGSDSYSKRHGISSEQVSEKSDSYFGRRDGDMEHFSRGSELHSARRGTSTEQVSKRSDFYSEKRDTVPVHFSQEHDSYSGRGGGGLEQLSRKNDLYTDREHSGPLQFPQKNNSFSSKKDASPEHHSQGNYFYSVRQDTSPEPVSKKSNLFPEKRDTVPVQFSEKQDSYSARRGRDPEHCFQGHDLYSESRGTSSKRLLQEHDLFTEREIRGPTQSIEEHDLYSQSLGSWHSELPSGVSDDRSQGSNTYITSKSTGSVLTQQHDLHPKKQGGGPDHYSQKKDAEPAQFTRENYSYSESQVGGAKHHSLETDSYAKRHASPTRNTTKQLGRNYLYSEGRGPVPFSPKSNSYSERQGNKNVSSSNKEGSDLRSLYSQKKESRSEDDSKWISQGNYKYSDSRETSSERLSQTSLSYSKELRESPAPYSRGNDFYSNQQSKSYDKQRDSPVQYSQESDLRNKRQDAGSKKFSQRDDPYCKKQDADLRRTDSNSIKQYSGSDQFSQRSNFYSKGRMRDVESSGQLHDNRSEIVTRQSSKDNYSSSDRIKFDSNESNRQIYGNKTKINTEHQSHKKHPCSETKLHDEDDQKLAIRSEMNRKNVPCKDNDRLCKEPGSSNLTSNFKDIKSGDDVQSHKNESCARQIMESNRSKQSSPSKTVNNDNEDTTNANKNLPESSSTFTPNNQSETNSSDKNISKSNNCVLRQEPDSTTSEGDITLEKIKSATGPYGFLVIFYFCKLDPHTTLHRTSKEFELPLSHEFIYNEATNNWISVYHLNGVFLSKGEHKFKHKSKIYAADEGIDVLRKSYYTVLSRQESDDERYYDDVGCKTRQKMWLSFEKEEGKRANRALEAYFPGINKGDLKSELNPILDLDKAKNIIKSFKENPDTVGDIKIYHGFSRHQMPIMQSYAESLGVDYYIEGNKNKFIGIRKRFRSVWEIIHYLLRKNNAEGIGLKYKILRPGEDWGIPIGQVVKYVKDRQEREKLKNELCDSKISD